MISAGRAAARSEPAPAKAVRSFFGGRGVRGSVQVERPLVSRGIRVTDVCHEAGEHDAFGLRRGLLSSFDRAEKLMCLFGVLTGQRGECLFIKAPPA